ncbi:MAG TPA: hypothetical protein VHP33_09120 [Polyangiaceae bacterium]|nr:hypothetical protein [Polyangiaceae bacterium]
MPCALGSGVSAMSAAHKIAAPLTSAELEGHRAAAERGVSAAAVAVKEAETALAKAPRDAQKRALAREVVVMAQEDLTAAKAKLEEVQCNCAKARRYEDEAAAGKLGERLSRKAQLDEEAALIKLFEQDVVGALKTFLGELVERRVGLMLQAKELEAIWHRLGNGFQVSGVETEAGTGRADIPPTVTVHLTTIESPLRARLHSQLGALMLAGDSLGVAAVKLLLPALDPANREQHSGRTLHNLVYEKLIAARGAK